MKSSKTKIKEIKISIVGKAVKPVTNGNYGAPGIGLEDTWIESGFPIEKTNVGADLPAARAEAKSRNTTARSRETVGCSSIDNIINTKWEDSTIWEKFQTQIRAYHDGKKVVKQLLCDFSHPLIQDLAKEAYEICRQKLANGERGLYITGNEWFIMEASKRSPGVYGLRTARMKKLEAMAKRNLGKWFSVA
jgi:hypothetical protein